MEEQFEKKPNKVGDLQRTQQDCTDGNVGSEDCKHTSGGVFVAMDSNLGAVVGTEEGAVASIPGNEGRIAQVWENVRGGMRMFGILLEHGGMVPKK